MTTRPQTSIVKQLIDQSAHICAAFVIVGIIITNTSSIWLSALIGFYVGCVREISQHGFTWPKPWSWFDLLFWTIGGALAHMVLR